MMMRFRKLMRMNAQKRQFVRASSAALMILATLFYSFGGLDLYLGLTTPFAPKYADAAYTGKQEKTVEFLLGGTSDATSRTVSGELDYVGSSWNTVKATAGQDIITIAGSGIRVVNAYLDTSFIASSTGNMTAMDVFFDAANSSSAGTDVPVGEVSANAVWNNTGESQYIHATHDVTAFFATTTDSQWSSGVSVTASASTTFSLAFSRTLTTVRLVITYEDDFSTGTHNEVKTVRFPLASTVVGDIGSRQAACAAAATCSFTYNANIPDLSANSDILDVHFELHARIDSVTASSIQMGVRGNTASSSAFDWVEQNNDASEVNVSWQPAIGSPNFQANTTQTLDVLMGTVPASILGGELVITYRYSTGAASQTETVRYFVGQNTAAGGTATTTFATTSVTVSNSGESVKNVWLRVHAAPFAAANLVVQSAVGNATNRFGVYAITATNGRAGDTATIIQDLSQDVASLTTPTGAIGSKTKFTVANSPVAVEVFVTFTWNGSTASDVTKTVSFSGAQQGISSTALNWNNRPVFLELPETVTKTYRSAYAYTNYMHSNAATTITLGSATIGVNASTTVITEAGTAEGFNAHYLTNIASTTLSGGDTIGWTTRAIELNERKSVSNTAYFGNEVFITYDASLGGSDSTVVPKQLRTIEYELGSTTENVSKASGVISYFGSATGTTKVIAGSQPIVIPGSNIRVVNAYLELGFYQTLGVNITGLDVFIDAANSSSAGTDAPVGEATAVALNGSSGAVNKYVKGTHDVTAFFSNQTDAQWTSGVGVTAAASTTFSAAGTRVLTSMRLIITYESDYNLVPHTEVKTVRFPLASTVAGDIGTRQSSCAAATTCSFTYTANIPDAVADGDILDVHFELHGYISSGAAAASIQMGIRGGTASSSPFNTVEAVADDNEEDLLYEPAVGAPDFQRNTQQTLDVLTAGNAVTLLGGELVVTYRYSTGATSQAETVRYFMNQNLAAGGVATTTIASTTVPISNGGMSVKNVWYRIHTAPMITTNLVVGSEVATTTQRFAVYAFTAANSRTGNSPTIIHDLSQDATKFWSASTTVLGGGVKSTVTNAPVGVEAFVTFTWAGSLAGTTTRSVLFNAAQQGVSNIAQGRNNRPLRIELPEAVTKTYRSAYLETNYSHSSAGAAAITIGTFVSGVNGTTTRITEVGDTTSFNALYFSRIASSTFSTTDTIGWKKRYLEINQQKTVANTVYFGNAAVITYDAVQQYKFPSFTQNLYRFYVDNDALTPSDPWPLGTTNLGENTEVTSSDGPLLNGSSTRIRMSFTIATTTMLASSTQFKLQYAPRVSTCSAVGSWSDLGAPGSGSIMRGYNATPADGTNLTTLLLSASTRAGLYQESNNTVANPFVTAIAEDVEYDWNVQNNGAATDTPYCFRMAKYDGTLFYSYPPTSYPTMMTAGYVAEQKNWRWYNDETNETPVTALAAENTAPIDIANTDIIKLRVTVNEANGSNGVDEKFRLQFSTVSDFTSGVTELAKIADCTLASQFCYASGVDADDDPISTLVLTDSTAKGRHNEIATSTSTMDPLASTPTEFEYTIEQLGSQLNITYYFRLWDNVHNRAVSLATGESYPSLATQGAAVSLSSASISSGVTTAGITTDVATTPTSVPFGTIPIGTSGVKAAQRFTITTDAPQGYSMFLRSNASLDSQYATSVRDVISTNSAPLPWASACLSSASGCWGYHTTDASLSGGSTRFVVNDTYAQFSTTSMEEVLYNAGPVTNDVNDIIYRVEGHQWLSAGAYTTSVQYILVPIF